MCRILIGAFVLGIFVNPLWAQLSVSETFQICGISPESLAVSDCDEADLQQMVLATQENLAGRQELEARRDALAQTKAAKQQLLEQLSDPEQSSAYENVLVSLQGATNSIEQATDSYRQYIVVMRESLIDHLTQDQQSKLQLAIRPEVQVLPAEYRLLDWEARQLTHLSRAIRMVESDEISQHPLISTAEAVFDVQYARQMLVLHLETLKTALAAL